VRCRAYHAVRRDVTAVRLGWARDDLTVPWLTGIDSLINNKPGLSFPLLLCSVLFEKERRFKKKAICRDINPGPCHPRRLELHNFFFHGRL
jgi:hypothetical protein